MNLRTETDRLPFQSAHIRSIIRSRAKSVSEHEMSMIILFVPTDMVQLLFELTNDTNSSSISDVLAASIVPQMSNPQKGRSLTFDGFMIDPVTRKVLIGKQTLLLPRREFDLLWFFVRHPRCVFTRSQLLDYVWGRDYMGSENTVTVHIRRLRKKIEPNPCQPIYLHTIWGVGYTFDPN
jgi:DNA-binding response OmpR family regulator